MTPKEKLTYARAVVGARSPYFATLLYSLTYLKMDTVGGGDTFGVTAKNQLLYTDGALEKWSDTEVAGVLEHELYHILFDDCRVVEAMGLDQKISNWAQDIRINHILRKAGRDLPTTEFYPENPKFGTWTDECGTEQPGFPPGLSFLEYYDLLKKHIKEHHEEYEGKGGGEGDGDKEEAFGHCGSGAGNPVPEEDDPKVADQEGRSEAEIEQLRDATAKKIQDYCEANPDKMAGSGMSPELLIWANKKLKPPTVPWQQVLKRRVRKAAKWVAGIVEPKYGTLSRRQCTVGYGHRSPILASYRAPVPNVVVVVDTSGSMSENDIGDGLSEVESILKTVRQVRFIACDTEVHECADAKNLRSVIKALKGGGGTAFQPVFDRIQSLPARERPQLCVFITDGYPCDTPTCNIPGMETLWCVTDKGPTNFASFGSYLHIGESAQKET